MKSGRSNLSNCKILWNNENTQFGIKNTLFRYFWAKIFKKYCHIWNQHPQICLIGNFCEKQNCLNLGPKMPYLGIFELELEKTIWNQHSRICLIAKFGKKKKMFKFETKNTLFGYFWDRTWKKTLSYLKSAISNFPKLSLQLMQWIFV